MAILVLQDGVPVDRKRRKSFVYAARVLRDNTIKIGVSGDIQGRLATIRSDKKSQIELIGVMPSALHDERRAHRLLAPSRADHEYYHDTEQVREYISAYLLPAERYGLSIKVCDKPYRLSPRPLHTFFPNPDNVSRYIDRILTADSGQREVMIGRLIMRLWHHSHREHWPAFVELFRNRLGVDLSRSARTYPYMANRKVYYTAEPPTLPAQEVAA